MADHGQASNGKKSGGVWGFFKQLWKNTSIDVNVGAPAQRAVKGNPTDPAARMEPVKEDRKETHDEMVYRTTDGAAGQAPMVRVDRDRQNINRSLETRNQAASGGGAAIPRGGGEPLAENVRAKMEPLLGAELSGVRVHRSTQSASAAESMNAKAFTVGKDVHFASGQYQPGTREGNKLLAHELTHVVQGKGSGAQRKADDGEAHGDKGGGAAHDEDGGTHQVSDPNEPAEKEAEAVADRVDALEADGAAGKAAGGKAAGDKAAGDKAAGDKAAGDKGDAKNAAGAAPATGGAPAAHGSAAPAASGAGASGAGASAAHGGASAAGGDAKPKESAAGVSRKVMRAVLSSPISATYDGRKVLRATKKPVAGAKPQPTQTPPVAQPQQPKPGPGKPSGTPPTAGATPPTAGATPQQEKKVATSLGVAPTSLPTLSWELQDDLRQAASGDIHSGSPNAPDPGTEQLLSSHPTASFDEKSKKLTLPAPDGAALAATKTKTELGNAVASQTGVGTVTMNKTGNNLSLTLGIGGLQAKGAITGPVETPPPPYVPKLTDLKAKALRQLTYGNQWFTVEDLRQQLKKDTSDTTLKTIDTWIDKWKLDGELLPRPGVSADWTFDKTLVEKQEKDNLLEAANDRVGELKTAWERGVNECQLTYRTDADVLTMVWGDGPGPDPKNKAASGGKYACVVADAAIKSGVEAAWAHRTELETADGGVKKPITKGRALMGLRNEESAGAKSAFQDVVGRAAALDCQDQSLAKVPATPANVKVRGRLRDNISYELGSEVKGNIGRTGRIRMPDSSVNHPKLPESLRRAIADKISGKGVRVTRGDGTHIAVKVELEMKPGEWVSIKEAMGPVFVKGRNEAPAEPDFEPGMLESIDRWVATDLLSQSEDHHAVPKWLGGPVNPPVYVVFPRVLHNFDDPGTPMDKKPRLGFHQVLNGLLKGDPLKFGTPGRPAINTDPDSADASVMQWASKDEPGMTSAQKKAALRAAVVTAFETVLKRAQPALVDEIKKLIEKDFPK